MNPDATMRTRGYLPHVELPAATYFLTFRLAGTLPQKILFQIQDERAELQRIARAENRTLATEDLMRLKYLETKKIQEYLDAGYGDCWLKEERVATVVFNALRFFEDQRYDSYIFCIMPNHVHWIMSPKLNCDLSRIEHSIKSYTASECNKILGRKGPFWEREYYDHMVRDREEFGRLILYVLRNPVKARLCKEWRDWKWTWCSDWIRENME